MEKFRKTIAREQMQNQHTQFRQNADVRIRCRCGALAAKRIAAKMPSAFDTQIDPWMAKSVLHTEKDPIAISIPMN
jgi:hypothetical protein